MGIFFVHSTYFYQMRFETFISSYTIYKFDYQHYSPGLSWDSFLTESALTYICYWGFSESASGKEPSCQCRKHKSQGFDSWVGKFPWRRSWQPLQYSCLENPMDRGAWWATVYGWQRDTTESVSPRSEPNEKIPWDHR